MKLASQRPLWWQWPTVLSLDAPAVVVAWQWLLARVARATLGWPQVAVLAASVWLAYAADRWIEGWRLLPVQVRTRRHAFYQRRRWPVAGVWLLVFAGDLAVAFGRLTRRELQGGWLLLAAVAAYLFSHQLIHRHHAWRPPKEACVAALLAGGTALFLLAQPAVAWTALGPVLALYALLCFANCALISAWEREIDHTHGQTSLSLQYPRGAAFSRRLAPGLAVLSLALLAMARGPARLAGICGFASSLLLAALDRNEPRLGPGRARVLADFALMTPFLPCLVLGWR